MYPENDNQTTTSLLLWPLTKNSRHYLCCNECHDYAANQRQGNLKLGINHTTLATVFPTKIVVGAFHCSDLIFYYWLGLPLPKLYPDHFNRPLEMSSSTDLIIQVKVH